MSKFLDKFPKLKDVLNDHPQIADKVEKVLEEHPSVDTALNGAAEELQDTGLEKLAKEGSKEAAVGGVVAVVMGSAFLPAAAGAAASYVAWQGAKGAYKALKNKPQPPRP